MWLYSLVNVGCIGIMKKKEIIILHGFIKKTRKTPVKEIEMAKKRLVEVMNNEL